MNGSPPARGRRRPRPVETKAKAEADEATTASASLDGFHLWGVTAAVASSGAPSIPTSSSNNNNANATANSAAAAGLTSPVERTLQSVTWQMEQWNHYLEDWSRTLYTEGNEEEAEVREIPEELRDLDVSDVQAFWQTSGELADGFRSYWRARERQQQHSALTPAAAAAAASKNTEPSEHDDDPENGNDAETEDGTPEILKQIPQEFRQTDFDILDPRTFATLLMRDTAGDHHVNDDKDDKHGKSNNKNQDKTTATGDDPFETPIPAIFPLQPAERYSDALDQVEVALHAQVREQAAACFQESLRFGHLQTQIAGLVDQTQSLQTHIGTVREHTKLSELLETTEHRTALGQLRTVLHTIQQLHAAESSLAEALAAQEDLTVLQHVQRAQKLWDAPLPAPTEASSGDDNSNNATETTANNSGIHQLQALQGLPARLDQYRQLALANLQTELVQCLLDWSPTSNTASDDRLRQLVQALDEGGELPSTRQLYQHRLLEQARLTIRTVVGEFTATAAGGNAASIGQLDAAGTLSCLELLHEQVDQLIDTAQAVQRHCEEHGIGLDDAAAATTATEPDAPTANGTPSSPNKNTDNTHSLATILSSLTELAARSVAEVLRQRKEAHTTTNARRRISLDDWRRLWEFCQSFRQDLQERDPQVNTSLLQSTLLQQARAWSEGLHEGHSSGLVAALDAERWTAVEVSAERQDILGRLTTGRSVVVHRATRTNGNASANAAASQPYVTLLGAQYKTVWSCLLLLEMLTTNIAAATQFPSLAGWQLTKSVELVRLFNARTTHLVLGAGAIHTAARLKSINAKHLSMVTQCLSLLRTCLPHVRAALANILEAPQRPLLQQLDAVLPELEQHHEQILHKFVSIIGGIVDHGLVPKIGGTDFDGRASQLPHVPGQPLACCPFLEGICGNVRKMHQVLQGLLPPDHLCDVFLRIFAYCDSKLTECWSQAAAQNEEPAAAASNKPKPPAFVWPQTTEGRRRLLLEVDVTCRALNALPGVQAWDFAAVSSLERRLDTPLHAAPTTTTDEADPASANDEDTDDQAEGNNNIEPTATSTNEDAGKDQTEAAAVDKEDATPATSTDCESAEDPAAAPTKEKSSPPSSETAGDNTPGDDDHPASIDPTTKDENEAEGVTADTKGKDNVNDLPPNEVTVSENGVADETPFAKDGAAANPGAAEQEQTGS